MATDYITEYVKQPTNVTPTVPTPPATVDMGANPADRSTQVVDGQETIVEQIITPDEKLARVTGKIGVKAAKAGVTKADANDYEARMSAEDNDYQAMLDQATLTEDENPELADLLG